MTRATYRYCLLLLGAMTNAVAAEPLRFDFGTGPTDPGWIQVNAGTADGQGQHYRVHSNAPSWQPDYLTSSSPMFLVVDLPEGNYRITVHAGDPAGTSITTIKSEARRVMVKEHHTAEGVIDPLVFCVTTRTRALADGGTVRINDRERDHPNWDPHLSLEFSNQRPCIAAVEIESAPDATTVYLAGDSTVTDQKIEPWSAWGQMLPAFFGPSAVVANHAESGRTLDSFRDQRRWQKILESLRPGDYVFLQFGHNDMKQNGEGQGPFLNFRDNLIAYIGETRAREAIPVLVTPMHRRRFDSQGRIVDTFGQYPDATRQVAREWNVPLIDLHAQSRILFEALGPEESRKAFVHYPPHTFPGQTEALKDDSHFSPYGASQLARCIVEGIRTEVPGLAEHLRSSLPTFDPTKPDPFEDWRLPTSPLMPLQPAEGS